MVLYMRQYVEIFRIKNVDEELMEIVAKTIENAFSFSVNIVDKDIEIPIDIFDEIRNQYIAEGIIYIIHKYKKEDSIAIVLADVDAYVSGLNFVFGLAIPSIRVAGVFLPRLRMHATITTFIERVKKEVLHELGHVLGLEHCSSHRCVMNFSNSVFDVDGKDYRFCRKCFTKLLKRGFNLKKEYVL